MDVAAEGKAIAKVNDLVIFVPYVVPGDVVDLQIKRKKNKYAEAEAVKFHELSPNRAVPFCQHYGVCGGCKWQVLPYPEQIKYKQKQVEDNLRRIGKIELPEISPILGSAKTEFYRNKLEFTFSNKRWLTNEEVRQDVLPGASLAEDAAATDAPAAIEETTTTVAEDPNEVLATVNGVEITRARFNTFYQSMLSYYGQYYDTTNESLQAAIRQSALEVAVQYELMNQKLVELGLSLTDEEIAAVEAEAQTNWDAAVQNGMEYMGITDDSTDEERASAMVEVLSSLEAEGFTEESYKASCVEEAGYNKLMDDIVKDVTVSDEDVQAEFDSLVEADKEKYEGHVDQYENDQYMNRMYAAYGYTDYITPQYYVPSGYRGVSHILLDVDDTLMETYTNLLATYEEQQDQIEAGEEVTEELVTLEQVEASKQAIIDSVQPTIDEINQKLADGVSFDELIQEYGTDPGMQDAATRAEGYPVHMDSTNWDAAFTAGAFTMEKIGDISEPVVGSYGVHILQYVRDVPSGAVELDTDLKESLRAELLSSKQQETFNAALTKWMDEANIVYTDAGLDIMPTTVDNAE